MKDWRGVPIYVGDMVVYPGRQGSSMWMNEGVVTALEPGDPDLAYSPDVVKVERRYDSGWRTWREDGGRVAKRIVPVIASNVTVVGTRIRTDLGAEPVYTP